MKFFSSLLIASSLLLIWLSLKLSWGLVGQMVSCHCALWCEWSGLPTVTQLSSQLWVAEQQDPWSPSASERGKHLPWHLWLTFCLVVMWVNTLLRAAGLADDKFFFAQCSWPLVVGWWYTFMFFWRKRHPLNTEPGTISEQPLTRGLKEKEEVPPWKLWESCKNHCIRHSSGDIHVHH